jgi:phosphomannomutase
LTDASTPATSSASPADEPGVDPTIFKAYDIRGLYGSQMDGEVNYLLGRAFARVLGDLRGKPPGDLRIGLGRDMRLQAPEMAGRLRDGLVAEGATVVDAGMVGTEMLYFLVGSRRLDGGAMVTASHNPKAYTGVKLVREGALALSGDAGINEIRDLVLAGMPAAPAGGSVEATDVYEDFQAHALSFIDPGAVRPLKVVVDGGNGMAGPMVGPLLERLGLDLVETYWVPDGDFPDHEPNPLLPENRQFVIDRVLSEGADLGIAWDGDADRCFFIDDTGRFVDGDFLTALLGRRVLEKHPGAVILYDVRASRAVPDMVSELGGSSYLNRVGHAFFKIAMRERDAAFGGEVSGHYYFRDFWCADSGTVPALLVLELLSVSGKRMSELVGALRERYFISGEINSEVADPAAKMRELAEQHPDAEIGWLDGVSVDYPDWHFNVRPSNTEPLLRLNLESLVSHADMESKRDDLLELIRG